MSQKYLKSVLQRERKELIEAVVIDTNLTDKKQFSDRKKLTESLRRLYLRYAEIVNNLCDVFDNIRDPTVADQSQRLYEVTVARLLQVKEELTKVQGDIYIYWDDLLEEKNLTPYNICLKIPISYRIEKDKRQKKLSVLMSEVKAVINKEVVAQDEEQEAEITAGGISIIPNSLVQPASENRFSVHSLVQSLRGSEKLLELRAQKGRSYSSRHTEIKIISMYLKKFLAKMKSRQFIGMELPTLAPKIKNGDVSATLRNQELREEQKRKFTLEWQRIKNQLEQRYKDRIIEDIEDEIREWYTLFYELTHAFPNIPPDIVVCAIGQTFGVPKKVAKAFIEKYVHIPPRDWPKSAAALTLIKAPNLSGSALIQTGNHITPEQYLMSKSLPQMRVGKDAKKAGKSMKNKKVNNQQLTFEVKDTECLFILRRLEEEMHDFENQHERKEIELRSDILKAINLESREIIDKEMRDELLRLQASLSRKKKGKKKGKKGRKRKKKKRKIWAGESTPEMVKELVKNGVLHEVDGAQLSDYRGERRLLPPPSSSYPGDIVDQLIHYGIFPLASATIHQMAPLIRSICLVGPEHSAKQFLANILVTETGATLFDLSPEHLTGLYEKKQELQLLKKWLAVTAQNWSPSIIFIKNVERLFYKKVPKDEKPMNPKRFSKTLKALIKNITSDERILVVATSSRPWLARRKQFFKTFDKLLIVPSPSYGTYSLEWQHFFEEASIPFAHTPFAKVAATINTGFQNMRSLEHAMGEAEVDRKDDKKDLIDIFASYKPQKDIDKKYKKFLSKTPMAKKKMKLDQIELEQQRGKKRR